ncbi:MULTISPECIES: PAS domain-containing protein [unclassified Coleofasciculus]|uniref:PAS domain-containing protein n=1 Tax=unclassified Coleofasciculus TaxID=2692782 RepID=UPI0018830BB3|nr:MULTISPECIES: PAS domain-containing protein [unclassified Coleofasciculus]MBE9126744.1 PAS domain-containing protein [Coleofasciculus sp. LEGE 07081]MBE9149031.1 PAS domain-containing protein [Coleofasciculus sp. LEGE 07092]
MPIVGYGNWTTLAALSIDFPHEYCYPWQSGLALPAWVMALTCFSIFLVLAYILTLNQLKHEIKERHQVEDYLRRREEQYGLVVDTVREVIFQTDAEGCWTFLNPAWTQITGFAIADSIGTSSLDYIHPDDRQSYQDQIQALIQSQKEYLRHEIRYRTTCGNYRWIEVLTQFTLDEDGQIIGTCGTLYNITERHLNEAALAKRERYLAALVEVQGRLLAFKGDNPDEPLNLSPYNEILPILGQVSTASRVYVFENHADFSSSLLMSQRAEWCTLGIQQEMDNPRLQNLSYNEFFPRWVEHLSQDRVIAGVVAEFPESERIILEPQGILSILVLPLKVNGNFFGFIGFDNCTQAHPWEASEVDLLRAAAAAVSLWYESVLAQNALRQSEARLRKQHRALSELAHCQAIYNGELSVALQEITETVAQTLEVERCSIWLYNSDRSSLCCIDLYKLTPQHHSAAYELTATQYPNYFKVLDNEQVIAATDAHTDPRTQEFCASYLTPLGITSMLDVPIRLGGIVVGVLCAEHTGTQRYWTLEEESFASTTAYMVSLAMEANTRATTEKALRKSEEQFRQLTENIREVFFLTSPDLRQIYYISPAYEEIWGRSPQSLYEQPSFWLDSVHPDDRERVTAAVAKHLKGQKIFEEEYRIVRPDGLQRWVWMRGFQVVNESGLIERTAGIAEDVTERKRAEAEILKALAKEKELGDLKSRFVSITSHEFRTPLATIMSTAELLEYYDWTPEEEKEQLQLIQETVKQMLQLLEDTLFIGIAEAGQLPFHPVLLDLREFCQELITEIQRGLTWKRFSSEVSYTLTFTSQGQRFLACMDRKLLRQLLNNLLFNAIKYSPVGGSVDVELICDQENAIFVVQDRGLGIPKEDQPRLFEFFHRGKNVGAIEGTGLGLAIVKKCVDLHGGQIAVNSEVGVGTTFIVTLPLRRLCSDQLC